MARKLFNLCVVLALVAGSWGGVLAAAACPHLGCQAAAGDDGHAASRHEQHREAAGAQEHSGHAASQTEGHAAAEPPSCHDQEPEPAAESSVAALASSPQSCAHCVGSRQAPPARSFEWQAGFARENRSEAAPRDFGRLLTPPVLFVREVIPATHAPPGRSARHLLLNVFRI